MTPGTYQIKDGNTVVAFAKVTQAGVSWTPKGAKGGVLATLVETLGQGVLPDGYTAKEMEVETGFQREKPDWHRMTPSAVKRVRWLKARGRL